MNAHSGEEYRQELRKGLIERREEIERLPWGAGSGFAGLSEGHFFCARIAIGPSSGSSPQIRRRPW
ncbi:MAG: hypothetical protein ACREMD_01075 [Gemmatimonadota bacterium]